MDIFSIFRSRDKPKNATAGSAFSFFLGGSASGKRGTEQSTIQITAVFDCIRILSEAITGQPDENGMLYYQDQRQTDEAPTMKGTSTVPVLI